MIRLWCPPRKVVAEQVQRPDIYAVCTPLEVPFKAKSEHCRLLNERVHNTRRSEGECNRECMRQAAWATRTVGGKYLTVSSVGRRSIRVSSARWPRRGGGRMAREGKKIFENCEWHCRELRRAFVGEKLQVGIYILSDEPNICHGISIHHMMVHICY